MLIFGLLDPDSSPHGPPTRSQGEGAGHAGDGLRPYQQGRGHHCDENNYQVNLVYFLEPAID